MYWKPIDQLAIKPFQKIWKNSRSIVNNRKCFEYQQVIWDWCWCDMYSFYNPKQLAFYFWVSWRKKILYHHIWDLRILDNFKHVGKLFQTVGVQQSNMFWAEHMLFHRSFSLKTEDIVFVILAREFLSCKYRGHFALKLWKH